jgi:hypothetical protein
MSADRPTDTRHKAFIFVNGIRACYPYVMPQLKAEQDYEVLPDLMEPADPAERERLLIEAEAEIEDGHGTSHDEVLAWLKELAAGHPLPPPCDQ